MPILSSSDRAGFLEDLKEIHSETHLIKRRILGAQTQYEGFIPGKQELFVSAAILATVFHLLSAKVGRMFRARIEFAVLPAGLLDTAAYLLEWASEQYSVAVNITGVASNLVPSSTVLERSSGSFLLLGARVGDKVLNVIDGSTAIIEIVAADGLSVTTTPLTGGTVDLYTSGDTYNIMFYNAVEMEDLVQIAGKYRRVVAVIPDSHDMQTTAVIEDA